MIVTDTGRHPSAVYASVRWRSSHATFDEHEGECIMSTSVASLFALSGDAERVRGTDPMFGAFYRRVSFLIPTGSYASICQRRNLRHSKVTSS
jgi:hypothetical protein